jgi:hypothetical protein
VLSARSVGQDGQLIGIEHEDVSVCVLLVIEKENLLLVYVVQKDA